MNDLAITKRLGAELVRRMDFKVLMPSINI